MVPFSFDDLSSSKLRPAVCLTNPIGSHNHVILAFITSKIPNEILETDIVDDSKRDDFGITGLHISSAIRLHRLMTVTTSFIQRELGDLSSQMKVEVSEKFTKIIKLFIDTFHCYQRLILLYQVYLIVSFLNLPQALKAKYHKIATTLPCLFTNP